eukprot:270746-Chlamydomonas_euryale.AAC.11
MTSARHRHRPTDGRDASRGAGEQAGGPDGRPAIHAGAAIPPPYHRVHAGARAAQPGRARNAGACKHARTGHCAVLRCGGVHFHVQGGASKGGCGVLQRQRWLWSTSRTGGGVEGWSLVLVNVLHAF